ncbi:MAG: endonuclease related protein [Thermotogota bacterium]|nr:endonuclease related protein [Thermotogota bacterium]MDK2863842.1 endonuclease related protein [Thermotogota bacterium]HCZ05972.1 endonuclease [Thermotogota bacterium]
MIELTTLYKKLLDIYGPQNWWPADTPFEVLVGAILTQNTAWRNVEKAIQNLKKQGFLEPATLVSLPLKAIEEAIKPSGFYKLKAKRLIEASKAFIKLWPGNHLTVSELRKELLKVHGIGPETADSIILYAFEKPTFVIDAYTRRLFARLGYFESENIPYDVVKRFVESRIPKDLKIYKEFHALIVEHAKRFCRKSPMCYDCPLLECPKKDFTTGNTTLDQPSKASS